MPVTLDAVQTANYTEARRVYDAWFDEHQPFDREAGWVRLVAALDTESGCRILAHTGEWDGGGRINSAQKAVLRSSAVQYEQATGRLPDGYGSNGGSVGALQQIPTPVARLSTKDGFDSGAPTPWDGWGTIVDCMVLATSIPKFLAELRVTDDPIYKGRITSDPIVADLLRVQQPLASEVEMNYGTAIVARAREIAARFQHAAQPDWMDMATPADVKQAFQEATAPLSAKIDTLNSKVDALSAKLDAQNAKLARDIPGLVWGNVMQSPLGPKRKLRGAEWLYEIWQKAEDAKYPASALAKTVGDLVTKVTALASKVDDVDAKVTPPVQPPTAS